MGQGYLTYLRGPFKVKPFSTWFGRQGTLFQYPGGQTMSKSA